MRIAALIGIPVVYVMTHDSIGLGEDGPTHQPVEHLAALRAMPNMRVFRPADAVETAECWQLALERTNGPTRAGPDAPEPAAGSAPRRRTAICRATRRLRALARRRRGARDPVRLRLRSGDCPRRRKGCSAGARHRRPRRVGALARFVPEPARGNPRADHRRCALQGCGRGGGPVRLGRADRPRRALRRHERFRRERALQGPLQAFRHHRRGRRRSGSSRSAQHVDDCDASLGSRSRRQDDDGQGRDQRLRPHRAQHPARDRRESGRKDIEVVAINDLGPVETNAHLLRYD